MSTIEYLDVALFSQPPALGDVNPANEIPGTRQTVPFVDGAAQGEIVFNIPRNANTGTAHVAVLRGTEVVYVW
jgi:hypothetical protein